MPYEAISYTWGDPYNLHIIRVKGQEVTVRQNLWRLLQDLTAQPDNNDNEEEAQRASGDQSSGTFNEVYSHRMWTTDRNRDRFRQLSDVLHSGRMRCNDEKMDAESERLVKESMDKRADKP